MDLQKLIEDNTTDGTIDFDALNEEIGGYTQKQIGAAVSKYKQKSAAKVAELEEQVKANEAKANGSTSELSQVMARMDAMEAEKAKAQAAKEFKAKAGELNVDAKIVDTFIDSGADLSKINLEEFKGADVKKAQAHDPNEDKDDEKLKSDEAAAQAAALKAAREARVI